MSVGITIRSHPSPDPSSVDVTVFALAALLGLHARSSRSPRRRSTDHVALGAAAMQVHDLPTALAHYEAALALDSTGLRGQLARGHRAARPGRADPRQREEPRAGLALRPRRAAGAPGRGGRLHSAPEGHFALAAAVGRASLTMGKKERIRRAAHHPRRGAAHHRARPAPRRRLSHPGPLERGDHAPVGPEPLLREEPARGPASSARRSGRSAISNMEHAVALDPGRLYHRLELAEIYVDRKRYDDARSQLAELAALPDREIMDSVYRRRRRRRWRQRIARKQAVSSEAGSASASRAGASRAAAGGRQSRRGLSRSSAVPFAGSRSEPAGGAGGGSGRPRSGANSSASPAPSSHPTDQPGGEAAEAAAGRPSSSGCSASSSVLASQPSPPPFAVRPPTPCNLPLSGGSVNHRDTIDF